MMITRRFFALLIIVTFIATGCATPRGTIERTAWLHWEDCYRLSNGTVELVVAPAVGRIMRYGFVGGDNQLWTNPRPPVAATKTAATEWSNHGGDKVWPWPQEWKQELGRDWPPPPALESMPHDVQVIDRRTLQLTSPPFGAHGMRVTRRIHLAPTGSRVTIESSLTADRPTTSEWAVWTVTAIAPSDAVLARLRPGGTWQLMYAAPWRVEAVGENLLKLIPPPDKSAKIGLDADLLAAQRGQVLFVQQLVMTDRPPSTETAQVFSSPPIVSPRPSERYGELEFTAPRVKLGPDTASRLTVHWTLHQVSGSRSIAKIINRCAK
jgi:hypothetical protein